MQTTDTGTPKQRITLRIDYHEIILKVNREEEAAYRLAAEKLKELYAKYATLYPRCTPEKLWVYVALDVAVDLQRDIREKDLKPVMDKIGELNAKVLRAMEKE